MLSSDGIGILAGVVERFYFVGVKRLVEFGRFYLGRLPLPLPWEARLGGRRDPFDLRLAVRTKKPIRVERLTATDACVT